MTNQSIEKFREYLENQNDDFLLDGRRIEGIIRDIYPEGKSLISLLTTAWKAGVVTELKQSNNIEVTIAQFGDRLSQEYGFKESSALVAVRVWAYALGFTEIVPNINVSSTPSPSFRSQSSITPETALGLLRDEFENVDEYERRINGLLPFKIGTVSFGRYDIEQGILPIENVSIYSWASQLKPPEEIIFLQVDREIAKSLKSEGGQEIALFVKAQATATKLAVERVYINWNNEEFHIYSSNRRDGRFIAYDNETVLDTSAHLMWAAKDNGTDITWQDAKKYCENYRGPGYTDWRMPTLDELAGLRASGNYKNVIACGDFVWASETRGSQAVFLNFATGDLHWGRQFSGDNILRAIPVRSDKEVIWPFSFFGCRLNTCSL